MKSLKEKNTNANNKDYISVTNTNNNINNTKKNDESQSFDSSKSNSEDISKDHSVIQPRKNYMPEWADFNFVKRKTSKIDKAKMTKFKDEYLCELIDKEEGYKDEFFNYKTKLCEDISSVWHDFQNPKMDLKTML